ncbi:MAG TPA: non-heme iron oxygenase ferredoxin subunit [Acidimicrobiales bacterium]|nr:non-heme iron oxygenase ferredoxin subunit [Acidimicrobiales bacterium]
MSRARVRVCSLTELELGVPRLVRVGGEDVCLVRCEDGVHAVSDLCTHEDVSLAEGDVDLESCEIECWKHGSVFSLRTGEALCLPATRPVAVYEVRVEGDDVEVVLGARDAEASR